MGRAAFWRAATGNEARHPLCTFLRIAARRAISGMTMKRQPALPLLLIAAVLTACAQTELTDPSVPDIWRTWPTAPEPPQPLLNTVWKLRDLPASDAHPAITLSPESHAGFIILEADGQHLTGYAGCQPMTALYHQQGARLKIDGLARIGSRCHKEKFNNVGDRFAAALSNATGYRLASDDALLHILNGDQVTATLIYRTPPKGHW
ncbi:META domain-containing protein [Stenotrophomonas rhizophila]|uniref:META domain-containing protein n=1 Tax=Stenotrophomonas rhizophila TaxID=216778 RepID=UPI001639F057|nr:META domain-containing protein [Stenotrophomonas rhizophila]